MSNQLELLASEKERELTQLRLQQAQQVSNTIKSRELELERERERFSSLQSDFEYNLALLTSRDKELAHYEASFLELKRILNAIMKENSELKVCLDTACKDLEGRKEAELQLKTYYQSRIKEMHSRMDTYRHCKQSELDSERNKLEQLQRELEQRLLSLEGETECQRNQEMAAFEEVLRQRDHEHQIKVEELASSSLAHEARSLRLERELSHARSTIAGLEGEARERLAEGEREEKEQKELRWRLEIEVEKLEERVRELEGDLTKSHATLQLNQMKFQKKHDELDKLSRSREATLRAAKESYLSREKSLEEQCVRLQALMEQREEEWQQREAGLGQIMQDKQEVIERVYAQLGDLQSSSGTQVKELHGELVEKDLKIQHLQDNLQATQIQLQRRGKEISQYSDELGRYQERVKSLEQCHAKQRLDWEGKIRKNETSAYHRQQELSRALKEDKEKLTAKCRDMQDQLEEQNQRLLLLQSERDAALDTLQSHGLSCDHHMTKNISSLEAQNSELRHVIKQMREELEKLTDQPEMVGHEPSSSKVSQDYVRYMESEVRKMKLENRELLNRLQLSSPQGKPPPAPPPPNSSSLKKVPSPPPSPTPPKSLRLSQHHLVALSETIATLNREKGELERRCEEERLRTSQLQDRLKEEKEMAYILKVCHVPQTKLHEKLIQATQVIISLVKEKDLLSAHIKQLIKNKRSNTGVVSRGVQASSSTKDEYNHHLREANQEDHQYPPSLDTGSAGPEGRDSLLREARQGGHQHQHPPSSVGPEGKRSLFREASQGGHHHQHPPSLDTGSADPEGKDSLLRGTNSSSSVGREKVRRQQETKETSHPLHGNRDPLEVQKWAGQDSTLASLVFTESSDEGMAGLEHVMELVEKGYEGFSSSADNNEVINDRGIRHSAPEPNDRGIRHSTPEPNDRGIRHSTPERPDRLELVGTEVKTHLKKPVRLDGRGRGRGTPASQLRVGTKRNVRNYNREDL